MRQHVMPEDICAEHGAQSRFSFSFITTIIPTVLLFTRCRRDLRIQNHPGWRDLVRRPRNLMHEIRQDSKHRARPIDPRPPTKPGIQNDSVQLGQRRREPARERAHGDEIAQVDVLGGESHPARMLLVWGSTEVLLQAVESVGSLS